MIIIYWKDLLLKSRIREFAQGRGITVNFVKNIDELAAALSAASGCRLLVDLSSGPDFARSFKGILDESVESVGVIAHIDRATEQAAYDSGFRTVIPRSLLVKDMDRIISIAD